MEIRFKNRTIEKDCTNYKAARKKYNSIVAEKLYSTLNFIENADTLLDVKNIPTYHLHQLEGNKKGIYAIDLGRKLGYRLLIIPLDDQGKEWKVKEEHKIFKSTKVIIALEVSKHYE